MTEPNNKKSKYEKRDLNFIDYNATDLLIGDQLIRIRKPVPERIIKGRYAVCIGAAQTYGPFVEEPYPLLLNNLLNFSVINLGRGGGSPLFFSTDNFINFTNQSSFAVIQIMAARGVENSSIKPVNRGGQKNVVIKETGQKVLSRSYYQDLLDTSNIDLIKKNISESRSNWIQQYQVLLSSIQVPKILFWFSQRHPDYQEKFTNIRTLYAKYPQLVNEQMVNSIKPYADDYVECVSKKGIPQKLVNRQEGMAKLDNDDDYESKKMNRYYPSPEMHVDAGQKLHQICAKYIPGE